MAVPHVVALSVLVALVASSLTGSASSQGPPHPLCPTGHIPCPRPLSASGSLPTSRTWTRTCILETDLCDGIPDCPGVPGFTADEANCTACSTAAFLCRKDNKCIRREWLCDRIDDCSDGEDERRCRPDGTVTWHGEELHYGNGVDVFECDAGKLRWDVGLCDGVRDCINWVDESSRYCRDSRPEHRFRFPVCHSGAVKCRRSEGADDSPCVPAKKVCDGWNDCLHGEDERNCNRTTAARNVSLEAVPSPNSTPSASHLVGGDPVVSTTTSASEDAVLGSINNVLVYISVVLSAMLVLIILTFVITFRALSYRSCEGRWWR